MLILAACAVRKTPLSPSKIPLEISILETLLGLRAAGNLAAHGFFIAQLIQEATGARLLTAHGTLYRALHRLEQAGFLLSDWEDPCRALEQGRPARRLYKVTAAGEAALAHADAPQLILQPKRAAP
jgi:PadR family transcriptional regulator PadR